MCGGYPFKKTYTEYANVTTQNGFHTFTLINARHSYIFRYFRGNKILAETAPVTPCGAYPMQIHTQVYPESSNAIQIIWNTNRSNGDEIIYYGTTPENLVYSEFSIISRTYTQKMITDRLGISDIPIETNMFPDSLLNINYIAITVPATTRLQRHLILLHRGISILEFLLVLCQVPSITFV